MPLIPVPTFNCHTQGLLVGNVDLSGTASVNIADVTETDAPKLTYIQKEHYSFW